jgi:fermentation-respiration switch protein FrsA (DUF1100 family)
MRSRRFSSTHVGKTQLFLLTALLLVLALPPVPSRAANPGARPDSTSASQTAPDQTWLGTVKFAGTELRIVFRVLADEDGNLTALMDSPDQGARDIPVDEVTMTADEVRFAIAAIGLVYEGKLHEDGQTITGTLKQAGIEIPVDLELVDAEAVKPPARPQEPQPPYPYREREVTIENEGAGLTLAGTLTYPADGGPFAAALLISGSGQQDRDESVFGHRPFLVLADYLTRRGIAVLRVDDRGVGGSTGDAENATTEDFVGDVLACVTHLRGCAEIDPERIGLIGHSEGGLIAPMAAVQSPDIAFIVLMAGPGLPGDEILARQSELIIKASGLGGDLAARQRALQERIFALLKSERDSTALAPELRALLAEELAAQDEEQRAATGLSEAGLDAQVATLTSPWMRFFLAHDPRPVLARVTCPVLAIGGELDLQVPARENLAAIEQALHSGGNTDVTVKELPGLNHLFQTAQTGLPQEYSQIEETIAPEALALMGDWIVERVGR